MGRSDSAAQAAGRGDLYGRLKGLLEELESMRPYFPYLPRSDRLLAELVLERKEALLKVAQDVLEEDGGVL